MKSTILGILIFIELCKAQFADSESDRRLIKKRPRPIHQQSSPCWGGESSGSYYDPVEEDAKGRKFLLVAGAAVGGAALGYHLGMKNKNPVIINNNIHNDYPSPCVVQSGGSAGGIIGGILGHHPIFPHKHQGGLWNKGGGGGNRLPPDRGNSINWNRAIRQFNRVVFPLTRGFK